MSVYRIAYRYALSFLSSGEEKGILDRLYKDAELIYETLQTSKELRAVLKNPVIKLKDKKEILSALFSSKINAKTLEFLNFILDKKRDEILPEIFREFLNLRDNREKILRTKIISAVEMGEPSKKEIEIRLNKKFDRKIVASYSSDTSLIGGFVVKVKDLVIDASVKHQLEKLRKKFSEDISILNN